MEEQDLFFVTNFHVICCERISASTIWEIYLDGPKSFMKIKEPAFFDLENDLAVFWLRPEDIESSEKPESFSSSFNQFQEELMNLKDSSPFHTFGFRGIDFRPRTTFTKRTSLSGEKLPQFSDSYHLYFAMDSVGYYSSHYKGFSGSPVISTSSKALEGILKATGRPGFLEGTDVFHLNTLLREEPLECSFLGLEI